MTQNQYRFEGQFLKTLASDKEAFDHALGWHDERDASIEKMIGAEWCPQASPIYHPEYFYGGKDGGWITENGLVEYNY